MRIKKQKTFMTLLFSNSLILLLVLIVSAFTFWGVTELYKDEIKKHYEVEAELDKMTIDSALKSIDELFYSLSTNEKITKISKYQVPLSNAERLTAAQVYNDFALLEINYIIENMYIVLPQSDLVLRSQGCNTMQEYYDIYLTDKFESYEAFKNMISNDRSKKFIMSYNGEDVFCINSLFVGGSLLNDVVVVIDFNEKLLLPHKDSEDGLQFMIYEKTQNGLAPVIGPYEDSFDVDMALKKGMYENGKKQYFVTSIDSNQSSWKYIYLVDMSNLSDRMAGMRLFLTIGISLTIVFGVILLLFLTKKQYAPIKELVSAISKNFGENSSYSSDYEYIGSIVKKFGEEFNPESIMKREKNLKELALLKLLRGESNNEAAQKVIQESLKKQNYMVAIFAVEDASELFFEKSADKNNESLARFILGNVFGEIFGSEFETQVCGSDNVVFIIGSDDEGDGNKIYDLLCDGQTIIEENFNLKFSAMMSQFHSGVENLPLCYREATECLAYRIFSNRGIVQHSEISSFNFRVGYSYTTRHEKSLANYLKDADGDAAKKLIDEMLDLNLSGEGSFSVSFRCMIYDIIGTIVKTIYEAGIDGEEFLKKLEIFEKIEKCTTTHRTREFLSGVIYECCEFIRKNSEKSSKKVIEHIKAFIALNYGDVNLSVSMIANKFDMNANYLSTLFKKENDITLSNYITVVRMEKAKEILEREHMKLEKVAHLCGYDSVRTFSRVFTNHTGLSPGKYREKV